MPPLSISVLGPLTVTLGAQPLENFAYAKVGALLAYLAVEGGQPHPRARLCALLWPNQPDRASRRNLSQALTQLRRAMGGLSALPGASSPLRATTDAVELDPAGVEVDAVQFLRLLDDCEQHSHRAWHLCSPCAQRQQAALTYYQGDFLSDLSLPDSAAFDDWALVWRERLRQRALTALERLVGWSEWRGAFSLAAAFVRRRVELDALNEAAHREAMRLLALNHEPAAANAQFDQLQRMLHAEFGQAPEAESVALRELIRAGTPAALRRLRAQPYAGPTPPTALLGRAEALTAIAALLRQPAVRALTLTGPPGIGKTRLALQTAYDLRHDYADGVHVVELAPVGDAAAVPIVLAQALAVRPPAATPLPVALSAYLKDKHALLVLDNFEHVIEAAAFVADLLAASPALQVLTTSRAPLRIRAEQLLAVPPLSPAAAQQLFLERARAAAPGLAAPSGALDPIAAICRRLDHLPLAIELIAGRARSLPLAELLRQLEQPLAALTAAPRDAPERHRTLRAAIAWSYDRLPPAEQRLFRHLGVFVGGATAAAAQAVVGETTACLPLLEALHEANLIQGPASDAETRFMLLETLREFALDQLAAHGEAATARQRHLDYFLALAERAEPALAGPEQSAWLNRLTQDHDNLRAALALAATRADETDLRLTAALGKFWEVRGHFTEGRRWLAEALARRPEAPLRLRGAALAAAGPLAYRQGDYRGARTIEQHCLAVWQRLEDEPAIIRTLRRLGNVAADLGDLSGAAEYYEQSLAAARRTGDVPAIAGAVNNLGLVADARGDYPLARTLFEEGLRLFQQLGDRATAGLTLNNLGLAATHQRDDAAAQAWFEDSLATFQGMGHKWGMALAQLNLGNLARARAQLTEAHTWHQQSLALLREMGDRATASYPLFGLGEVAYDQGDYMLARSLYRESLAVRLEAGEVRPMPRNLEAFGQLAKAAGRLDRAACLFGAAAALRDSLGLRTPPHHQAEYEREVEAVRAGLGAVAFETAWEAGRALTLEQAVALAQ